MTLIEFIDYSVALFLLVRVSIKLWMFVLHTTKSTQQLSTVTLVRV